MANSTPTRFLTDAALGGGSSATDLALKVFSGIVLEAFREKTVFYDNTGNIMATKVLESGKSAQWPIIGDDTGVKPIYHTPGNEILGQSVTMTEGTITVDEILVSHLDIPFKDLEISHFDVLAPYATKLGRALAIDMDKKLGLIGLSAARTAAVSGVHNGGKQVLRNDGVSSGDAEASITTAYPNSSVGSSRFRDDIAELAQKFDEDNVPETGRYLFIPPYIRTILRHEATTFGFTSEALSSGGAATFGAPGNPFSKDVTSVPGDINRRLLGMLEGFNLIVTNHMPGQFGTTGNYSNATVNDGSGNTSPGIAASGEFQGANTPSKYQLNVTGCGGNDTQAQAAAKPAALALCGAQEGSAAIGMVQSAGLRSILQDDERRNTKFMKSQMLVGAGVLAPWCAGQVGVFTSA
jgi:hypothetical protein